MKQRKYFIICVVLVSFLLLTDVAALNLFRDNTRWYLKDNITFWADLNKSRQGDYYNILEIGTPEFPYAGTPGLTIKLPDGTVFRIDKVDGNFIEKKGEIISAAKGEYPIDWPKGSKEVYIGAYTFVVFENKIISFTARYLGGDHWDKIVPEISDEKGKNFYKFPMKQGEVVSLFGEANEIRNFFIQ